MRAGGVFKSHYSIPYYLALTKLANADRGCGNDERCGATPQSEETCGPISGAACHVVSKPAAASSPLGRRSFLKLGAALTGGAALAATRGNADPLPASPPADAPWSQSLGAGVVDRPYGRPADTEAGVIRRNVPWLTAGTKSFVSFSPLPICRASSRRTGCSSSAIMPDGPMSIRISTG